MRATTCLAKGFWGRSLDEFKRLSNIALTLEGIKGATQPYELQSFHDPQSVQQCKTMSDAETGGFSTANLDWMPPRPPSTSSSPTETSNGYARFHGTISTELPKDRPDVQRTGFAAWRTMDQRSTLFGRSLWNIDPYVYLAMRIKSDGRSYFINVQTESLIPTDLQQHRLFAKRPGEWETVILKWNDFVRTNHGFVVEPQTEIMRQKITTIGLGLTDRVPGPFELCIERIWATNNLSEADNHDTGSFKAGQLKNKQGQRIKWGTE